MQFWKKCLGERGQTAVEYIFMLAVMSIIVLNLFGRLKGYLYENPDSLLGKFTSSIASTFNDGQLNMAYKRFALLK
jgi:Flp pilus assembly pilin Flp